MPGGMRYGEEPNKPAPFSGPPKPTTPRKQTAFERNLIAFIGIGLAFLFGIYNNVVTFEAGYDGCNYGPATEIRCGLQPIGTAKGKSVAMIIGAPGYLAGRVIGGHGVAFD